MKLAYADAFKRDYKCLPREHQALVAKSLKPFMVGAGRHAATGNGMWAAKLRVHAMKGHSGIWEMTWSHSSPDGRATWQWDTASDGSRQVLFRRVGNHAIYKNP